MIINIPPKEGECKHYCSDCKREFSHEATKERPCWLLKYKKCGCRDAQGLIIFPRESNNV